MNQSYKSVTDFIRDLYQEDGVIPLHEPKFIGNERLYLSTCLDSTYVSSIGKYVDKFERMIAEFTGAKYAVCTVNGTAALHTALRLVGVERDDEVITQPLSFVATCNAITYCGASPVFIDVDIDTLGMSPDSLLEFLSKRTVRTSNGCININSGKRISAVVPMHTFGHPCRIAEIAIICENFGLSLVEDAAESLGSTYQLKHTGLYSKVAALSFNGNKIITTGGGGMVITNDKDIAIRAKHITTTAKLDHPYEFFHNEIGYNYRLPNINAALGCAQVEVLPRLLDSKRFIAKKYAEFFEDTDFVFISEPKNSISNYWLNALILENRKQRDDFLNSLITSGIMVRPIWRLMNKLPMFKEFECCDLKNASWLEDRVVNLPSSAII